MSPLFVSSSICPFRCPSSPRTRTALGNIMSLLLLLPERSMPAQGKMPLLLDLVLLIV